MALGARTPAWLPQAFLCSRRPALPSRRVAGVASTSAISPARAWRKRPRRTAKQAKGGAGPAGSQSRERRGAGTLLGAGAAAGLGRALLSAGSGFFFRERLPWVTRLRGDTALPSPSGNLSIGEIDNPQCRAAHPLYSPCCGARRPKVAPLAGRGRCPDPSSAKTWPLQLVGEAPKGGLGEPPPDECSQGLLRVLASTARAAGTRGAPLWLGQNLVECRSCFSPPLG